MQEHPFDGHGMISVQALREFYSASRRLRRPLSEEQTQEIVGYFAAFSPIPANARIVFGAVRRSGGFMPSFPALILESALSAGADRLLTEDLQHGQEIAGFRIEHPFL